jgi:hypothetical protein
VLRTTVEMRLGDDVAPWQIHQDSSGAVWFLDQQRTAAGDEGDTSDKMGRVASDQSSITVRLPADRVAPGEFVWIRDFVTVGTDAWVVFDGIQQRVAVFDSAGRTRAVLPIDGARTIEADGRGHVWVSAVTGTGRKQAQLWDIDPATMSKVDYPFPATGAIDDVELRVDTTGTVVWALTTADDSPHYDFWTVRDGAMRSFPYQRPTLWYKPIDAVSFAVDKQGRIWFPAGPDLVAISARGVPRVLHLGGAQYIEDLVAAPDSGVIVLVATSGTISDTSVAPARDYLTHVASPESTAFPPYFRLPEPLWIPKVARGRPAVIAGTAGDLLLSAPGRHSVYRFPIGVLQPRAVDCGAQARIVDRLTRAALPAPWTRADIDAAGGTISAAEWRTMLNHQASLATQAAPGLEGLVTELPGELGPAIDIVRDWAQLQQRAVAERLRLPGTLDSEHYIASFRVQLMDEAVIAVNGVRELCGLSRLDFDRNDVWGAARRPTVQ